MPVKTGRALVIDLKPVHAHVPAARLRVTREDQRQGDVATAIQRPTLQDGDLVQVDFVPGEDHILAGPALDRLRLQGSQVLQPRQSPEFVPGGAGDFQGRQSFHPGRQFLVGPRTQSEAHALVAAELIDEDRYRVTFRAREQQGRASSFDHPICDLGDLEYRVYRRIDDGQLPAVPQKLDEVAQVFHSRALTSGATWRAAAFSAELFKAPPERLRACPNIRDLGRV